MPAATRQAASLRRLLPGWAREYERADLRPDITAGLTTAILLVPQGMAYAMLAGLPPIVGLYAALAPGVVYALLGTSRQLSVAPVAMDSMLVASAIAAVGPEDTGTAVVLAGALALLVGGLQLLMATLRLGALLRLLTRPVVSGFTSAAAVLIALSQLQHLFGVRFPRVADAPSLLLALQRTVGETRPTTLAIGLISAAALIALRRWAPKVPGAVAVVVGSSLLALAVGAETAGVSVVGAVPAGLPGWTWPAITAAQLQALLPGAVTLALVGYVESISIGRAFATPRRCCPLDANRELFALGAANLAAGVTHGYPVAGGLSRTAVHAHAGARSQLASLVTVTGLAVVLLFLTPAFTWLPHAGLAAIVIVAVVGLIDVGALRAFWGRDRAEAGVWLVAFGATLIVGIAWGLLCGVGVSLALRVVRRRGTDAAPEPANDDIGHDDAAGVAA